MAQKSALKIKKKRWFEILASRNFNNMVIGETLLTEPRLMIGKTLKINLMSITRDIKKQDINVTFKIVDVQGDKGMTELVDYEMSPASIKRIVRRGKDKLDDSFVAETQDKKIIRVKMLLLTKAKVRGSVLSAIRKIVRAYILSAIEKLTYEQFINEILGHRIQGGLKAEIKRIYPLKFCEVRRFVVETGKVKLTKKPVIEHKIEEVEETEEEKIIEKVKEKKEKMEDDALLNLEGLESDLREKNMEKAREKRK